MVRCISIITPLLIALGCAPVANDRPADAPLPVFAGIPPLEYVVEQIGGKRVKVESLIRPGQDPHTFEPTPRQVVALGRATVYFKIDMPFENTLLEKIQAGNPQLAVVDAARGIAKRPIDGACCDSSADGHHEEHLCTEGLDPHVWLSPPLLKTMAENVAEGLCRVDSANAKEYRKNLAALLDRIDALHERIEKKLKPYRGRTFYVFHPGFGYFADAYGLKEVAVEIGGRAPTVKQLRALVEQARTEGAKTVFVQPEFGSQSIRVVAEAVGAKIVPLDGLRRDVLAGIEDIAEKIEKSMQENLPEETRK